MIHHFLISIKQIIGSSFLLPAHGSGGARATIKIKAPQKNRAKPEKQKGKKEGGLGEGIFALLRIKIERFRFSLVKRNTKQKNFLFLLKEKIAREKIKKCRENFSVLICRSEAEASGNAPHSCSGFSLKKVRISFRIRSQIVCSAFVASAQSASARPPEAGKADFKRICHAPRGSKNNSRSRKIRFAVAKQQNPALRDSQSFFLAPKGELQSDNNSAKRNCPKAILLKK
jgi:hypothetical protein